MFLNVDQVLILVKNEVVHLLKHCQICLFKVKIKITSDFNIFTSLLKINNFIKVNDL